LKKFQGLRLPVFVKILARDMRPFEKSVLLKIGWPPMRRNWLFHHSWFKACSRDKRGFTDRLHQTSKLHNCCCLSQEFSGFSVIVWLKKLPEYVDIHNLLIRHGKSLNCSQYVAPIEPRSHGWLGALYFYMWEIPFTLVFTFLFSWSVLRLCDRKFVFASDSTWKVSQMCHRNCHRSIKEKELSQKAKSLFVEGLEISPNLGTEKIHRLIYFYINKSPHNICFSFSIQLNPNIRKSVN